MRHGYQGIDDTTFTPLIHTQLAGRPHRGWVQLSDGVAQMADQLAAGAHAELGVDVGEVRDDHF